ncbi:MAG: hypothetical protein A4E64_02793 [Syntrophorhabdus sp. PtaU1.Bin058]|nr:MAG: hypothetical protein A4E64_02793 [Syntrophorhabdus sp. PtaU1.Bin058]
MKYRFFLDETGDHGLSYIDKNFPLFLLCGCLFQEDDLNKMETDINTFKTKYFKTTQIILHSREIRKCEGPFQILFNLDIKASFYAALNKIIENTTYKIIGAGINKEKHIKKYGKSAKDPYSLSLSFIIERLMFCLDSLDKNGTVEIEVEERGKKEDTLLLSHFNSILDRGTYYISSQRLKKTILSFGFYSKKENVTGLQIADLCAYPLARHLLNPEIPYIPFDIIEKKIYCNKKGEYKGWGLKVFP